MKIDCVVACVLSMVILLAAFRYERADLGCSNCFDPSVNACSDARSVYVRDAKYERGDSSEAVKRKLKKLLNHDDTCGSWKRCVLWSFLLSMLNYTLYARGGTVDETNVQSGWLFLISWLVNFSVLYALKSFESFHIFRMVKRYGYELVSKL
jgi:hypothetical protein